MKFRFLTLAPAACLAGTILTAIAVSSGQAQGPASYMYTMMLNIVGPPANSFWEIAGADRLTDQDWARAKQMVGRLSQTAPAISVGGTSIDEIERAKSPGWKNWAGKFTDAVSAAGQAVERRDRMRLVTASETLVEACEGCHTAFPPVAPR